MKRALLILFCLSFAASATFQAFSQGSNVEPEAPAAPASGSNVEDGGADAEPAGGGNIPDDGAEPVGGGNIPDDGAEPVGGGNIPDDGAEPVGGGNIPDDGAEPVGGGNIPDDGTEPAGGGNIPDDGTEPAGGGNIPDDGSEPVGGGNIPDDGQPPAGGGNIPDDGGQPPAGGGNLPEGTLPPVGGANDGQWPTANPNVPAGHQPPAGGSNLPNDGQPPAGGGNIPDDGGQPPAGGSNLPEGTLPPVGGANDGQWPTANPNVPAGHQPPAGGSNLPNDGQPPAGGGNIPDDGGQPPAGGGGNIPDGGGTQPPADCGETYTTNADFDQGALFNVNHDVAGQLRLNTGTLTTFPTLWVANAGEDTISKIDTDTGKELARYRTWFGPTAHGAWSGPAPSRTAIDRDGNCYVANRHFDGKAASIVKIFTEGGVDRNGNGVVDTSVDSNGDGVIDASEILPLTDSNGNGVVDPEEIVDERVAWIVQVGPNNGLGRALAIDREGDLWLGLYNSRAFYEVSSANGAVLRGPFSVSNTPYGAVVDGDGILWGASLGSLLLKLDTVTGTSSTYNHSALGSNYGIAIGNGAVYLGGSSRSYIKFDPVSETFSDPAALWHYTTGVAVDSAGAIYVAGDNKVSKFNSDDSLAWSVTRQAGVGSDQRGVVVDADGNLWTINRDSWNIAKYRSSDGGGLGVFPVGREPYTYTDATGLSGFATTLPTGTWTVVNNAGAAGVVWDSADWTADIPAGTSVKVEARASDNAAGLELLPYLTLVKGQSLCNAQSLVGQYLQVKVTFTRAAGAGVTPVLYDLTITCCGSDQPPGDCDAPVVDAIPTTQVSNLSYGFFLLTASSACCAPADIDIYVMDTESNLLAGPYKDGDIVRIRRIRGSEMPNLKPGRNGVTEFITTKGDVEIGGVDCEGATGPALMMPVE